MLFSTAKIIGGAEQGELNWTITQQSFDANQSNVFFLSLGHDQNNITDCLTSHYFNLTQPDQAASSRSGPTSLPSSTVSATSTDLPSSGATGSDNSSSQTGESKLGVGLGVGLGVPLVLLALYFAFAMYRERQEKQPADPTEA